MKSVIASILHGLGDSCEPLPETVKLVEEILGQQIRALTRRAFENAMGFRSSPSTLHAEDLVYLMRRNPVKVRRLLHYLSAKSKAQSLMVENASTGAFPSTPAPAASTLARVTDFLNLINAHYRSSPEMDSEDLIDQIKTERDERLELYSRILPPQDYLKFSRARQVHFGRAKDTKLAFNRWLQQELKLSVSLDQGGLMVLQYLAYETVAALVDYCFLVRRDQRADAGLALRPDCVLQHGVPVRCADSNSIYNSFAKSAEAPSLVGLRDPITPAEVREAFRRATFAEPPLSFHCGNKRLPCSDVLLAV